MGRHWAQKQARDNLIQAAEELRVRFGGAGRNPMCECTHDLSDHNPDSKACERLYCDCTHFQEMPDKPPEATG
jgi:hypothetical protein